MTEPQDEAPITAAVMIIGNEILSGRTTDANLPYIASELTKLGIRLLEVRVVADIESEIIDAVNALRARYTYLFTTGGIGPTHDDITAAAVAKAFGLTLHRHPDALALMQRRYKNPADLTPGRLKMTEVPVGASLVDNPVSGAPGFQIANVFVMAGIPAIARAMFDGLRHRLKGGPPMLARTVVSNLGEGLIATDLGLLQERYPDVEIGSYPFHRRGVFGSSLVLRSIDVGRLEAAADEVRALVRRLGGEPTDEPA
jgi:molybdenum cofactor synthesis domain-containing protein